MGSDVLSPIVAALSIEVKPFSFIPDNAVPTVTIVTPVIL